MERPDASGRRLALHGWIGITLVVIFWAANWHLPGLRTHLLFAPLWLGYVLTVDALVLRRTGTSLLTRSPRTFWLLFLVSAPAWWLFELFNLRTNNWIYVGREHFSDAAYFALATLSFSTVMPAVFTSAELVYSLPGVRNLRMGPRLAPTPRLQFTFVVIGIASAVLVWTWPESFYPLVWGIVFFLVEPLNRRLGRPSIGRHLQGGDWRPVVSLALGALLCGFFWELWNYLSYPKWTYRTPGVDFLHVFEMPAAGYLGYVPFGLELYVLAGLVLGRDVLVWRGGGQRREREESGD